MNEVSRFGFATTAGLVEKSGEKTPQCCILVEPGGGVTYLATNEVPTAPLSAPALSPLPPAMADILRRSQSLVIDGYAFAGDRALVASVLAECRGALEAGSMTLFLDPQAVGAELLAGEDAVFCEALALASALVLNEDEAHAMTGLGPDASVRAMFTSLISVAKRAKILVIKRGCRGCSVAQRNRRGTSWMFNTVPSYDIGCDAYDSTGCGDAFLGAMISGLAANMSVVEAASLGNAAGGATAMQLGAGICGVALREDIERLMSGGPVRL